MTMSIGINTNVQFEGKIYHIQTEDGGIDHPTITTLLFKDGAVFASRIIGYKEIIQSPNCRETVTEMMKEQHKTIIRDLVAGKINRISVESKEKSIHQEHAEKKSVEKTLNEESGQEQKKPSLGKEKNLDDYILEYLSKKEKGLD